MADRYGRGDRLVRDQLQLRAGTGQAVRGPERYPESSNRKASLDPVAPH